MAQRVTIILVAKDVMKDFERRTVLWIIQGGPKCKHVYPNEIRKRIDKRGGGSMTTETEIGMVQPPNTGKGEEHVVP